MTQLRLNVDPFAGSGTVLHRARRASGPQRAMSRYQIAFLRHFKRGERVESSRVFPLPRTLKFVAPNGETYAASEIVLSNLLRRGLQEPAPQDTQWDSLTYRLTPAGRAIVDRMRSRV